MRALLTGVATLAIGASAQAMLLNSFDSTTGITNPGGVTITVAPSTIGVTEGTGSVAATKGNGWSFFQFDITPAQYAAIVADKIVKLDYTYTTADNSPFGGWGNGGLVVNSQTINTAYGGWDQSPDQDYIAGPANIQPGTHTMTFDTSTWTKPILATPGTWQNMAIVINWAGSAPQTMYFDNLRTAPVPEPTVLAGVAVASLGLMLRKRSK